MSSRRYEVWGAPIRHSRSPELHRAAYRVLGVDWDYRASYVAADELARHFSTVGPNVAGLSLTMPLKEAILELVADHRGPVDLLHAANTAIRGDDGRWWLDNTDWWGAWKTLDDAGGVDGQSVWVLGAGATARAVLYALSRGAPESVTLLVRSPDRARVSQVLGTTLGLRVEVALFDEVTSPPPQWVVSALPGGVVPDSEALSRVVEHARLFDISYDPWPSALASLWATGGQPVLSGLGMLVYQALAQLRAFAGGDSQEALPNEQAVLHAMRVAVGLGESGDPSVKQ